MTSSCAHPIHSPSPLREQSLLGRSRWNQPSWKGCVNRLAEKDCGLTIARSVRQAVQNKLAHPVRERLRRKDHTTTTTLFDSLCTHPPAACRRRDRQAEEHQKSDLESTAEGFEPPIYERTCLANKRLYLTRPCCQTDERRASKIGTCFSHPSFTRASHHQQRDQHKPPLSFPLCLGFGSMPCPPTGDALEHA